jgi:hypothetical protein
MPGYETTSSLSAPANAAASVSGLAKSDVHARARDVLGHPGRVRRGDDEGGGGHELEQVLEDLGAEPACRAGENNHGGGGKRCFAEANERGRELDEPPDEHVMAGERKPQRAAGTCRSTSLSLSLCCRRPRPHIPTAPSVLRLPPERMKKLPLDLVPLIFEHVRGDRDALRCFALVHTSWSLPAQRLLFDTVTIGLLQEWKWLLHTLMSSPRLRSLVHELVWSVIRPWSQVLPCYQTHVPELLPNVTKLTFQGEVIIDLPLMSALPSLETLVIRCDYAWFNELHDPPPVEIALWPSCIRSVHIEQSRIAICSLRWFDMNMIVNPVRTASIYGPVEHVPQMRRFVERHTDLEHLSVDIEGYRGVYGPGMLPNLLTAEPSTQLLSRIPHGLPLGCRAHLLLEAFLRDGRQCRTYALWHYLRIPLPVSSQPAPRSPRLRHRLVS